jgi:hypothetical protein
MERIVLIMQNRVPKKREARPPLPDFAPVPRKYRHDGWTPERQRAFIEALADTGCVTRAAGMVNMAQRNCYYLRRQPGAEDFRRAWDAALDFGVDRLKDIAFERAIEGELTPYFQNGKLAGFHRKYNNALLMFCIRHYGRDAGGKRTTINYFSSRATAGSVAGGGGTGANTGTSAGASAAETSTTTVRTVITGDGTDADNRTHTDALAQDIESFQGIEFDAQAQAEIDAVLLSLAERRRAEDAVIEEGGDDAVAQLAHDPGEIFVRLHEMAHPYLGTLEPPVPALETIEAYADEPHWSNAGAEMPADWAEEIARMEAAKAVPHIAAVKRPKRQKKAG